MVQLTRWKIILVAVAVLLSALFAFPNLLTPGQRAALPGFVPSNILNLGLDLQGGSYLMLQVDVEEVRTARVNSLIEDMRVTLGERRIAFSNLQRQTGGFIITITDPSRLEIAQRELTQQLARPNSQGVVEVSVSRLSGGRIRALFTDQALNAMSANAVDQSIEVVRRRIDSLGTREPSITRQGADRIVVQAPGESDPEALERIIGQTAQLTFQMVDHENSLAEAIAGRVPPDSILLPTDDPREPQLLVKRRVLVSGENLTYAGVGTDQNRRTAIDFRFDGAGARRFSETTSQNINRRFAIILDGTIISAPNIISAITGGSGQITGNFSVSEAAELVNLLNGGALPAPLTVEERRVVSAGLGADAVEAGMKATLLGFALVVIFMILSYGLVFGTITTIGMAINGLMIVAAMSLTQATLTLPGIAGLILTLAMAVDANVLIYERMREEARAGKSAIMAADAGFTRAMATIFDANLTTLVAALIMFQFGAGPVRGFAWTLSIGVFTSVFTAVLVTQIGTALWFRITRSKTLPIS